MEEEEVMTLQERVAEAQRNSKMEMKCMSERRAQKMMKKKAGDNDDTEESRGVRKRLKGKSKMKFKKRKK